MDHKKKSKKHKIGKRKMSGEEESNTSIEDGLRIQPLGEIKVKSEPLEENHNEVRLKTEDNHDQTDVDGNVMLDVLNKMSEVVKGSQRYDKALAALPWADLVPPGADIEEVKDKTLRVIAKIRKWRSISEVVADAKEYCKVPTNMLAVDPRAPKKPMTSFFQFYQEKVDKLKKKHPEMSGGDITKLAAAKFKELPTDKKEKYNTMYTEAKKKYDEDLSHFLAENPMYRANPTQGGRNRSKVAGNRPPVYVSPMQHFINLKTQQAIEKHPEKNKSDCQKEFREKWAELSDHKKLKYISLTLDSRKQYQEELDHYIQQHPSYKPPRTDYLFKSDKEIWDRHLGIPEKPPQNGYMLFRKDCLSERPKGQSILDYQNEINRKWKNMSRNQQLEFDVKQKQMQEEFDKKMESYISTLGPEEREEFMKTRAGKQKPKKPKKTKPSGAFKLFVAEKREKYSRSHPDLGEDELYTVMEKAFDQIDPAKKAKYEQMCAVLTPKRKRSSIGPHGIPKPPATGYHVYYHEQKQEYAEQGIAYNKEMLIAINASWSALPESKKKQYNEKKQKLTQEYEEKVNQMNKNGNGEEEEESSSSDSSDSDDSSSDSDSDSSEDEKLSQTIPYQGKVDKKRKLSSPTQSSTQSKRMKKPGADIYTSSSDSDSDMDTQDLIPPGQAAGKVSESSSDSD